VNRNERQDLIDVRNVEEVAEIDVGEVFQFGGKADVLSGFDPAVAFVGAEGFEGDFGREGRGKDAGAHEEGRVEAEEVIARRVGAAGVETGFEVLMSVEGDNGGSFRQGLLREELLPDLLEPVSPCLPVEVELRGGNVSARRRRGRLRRRVRTS
jgi:hypothetical protein